MYLPGTGYSSIYGTNWASEKVGQLLDGSVECVILPYDNLSGSLNAQIDASPECPAHFGMSWEEAEKLHPLVMPPKRIILP